MVCYTNTNFTIENLPPVISMTWTCGPGLTLKTGQNTPTCTFLGSSSVNSWVKITLVDICGVPVTLQKTVWVGPPDVSNASLVGGYLSYPSPFPCISDYYKDYGITIQGNIMGQPLTASWSGLAVSIHGGTDGAYFTPNYLNGEYHGSGNIVVEFTNAAGSSFLGMGYGHCSYMMVFSPNPASSETTAEIQSISQEEEVKDMNEVWVMEIYTESQMLKEKKSYLRGNSQKINTQGWKEGVYIVRAYYKGELITGKLVVKNK